MNYNSKDFTNWIDAERWMSKHGYGVEQIRLAKIEWDSKTTKSATEAIKTADSATTVKPATVVKAR